MDAADPNFHKLVNHLDGLLFLEDCRFVNDELQTLGKKRGQLWGPSN